jgi:hypothetical protein
MLMPRLRAVWETSRLTVRTLRTSITISSSRSAFDRSTDRLPNVRSTTFVPSSQSLRRAWDQLNRLNGIATTPAATSPAS